ncbi:MAG TPA: hypothetical protein ENJ95_11490 [Bacteroidetes bacterium]|nr:hypothetical protein [Bacteroidota bacterium]
MDLQILVSKKGTKVVKASDLYIVLGLPNKQYATNLRRWINDVYQFRDGIRKPAAMKDYAKRPTTVKLMEDYYFSIEFAKLIVLNSKSKVKQKYATFLYKLEDKTESNDLLNVDQVMAVLELAKVMGMVSCQTAAEQKHLETYEQRNNGSAANWWNFRSKMLGYSTDQLKQKMQEMGKSTAGKSRRHMLMQTDKYEMVRTGVVDLFMAMGKTERYAKNLGRLAKAFAKELKVEIFDDRNAPLLFTPHLNKELANEVKHLEKGRYLQLWEPQRMAS